MDSLLGKDVAMLIYRMAHIMCMTEVLAEYRKCVRPVLGSDRQESGQQEICVAWHGNLFLKLYNYRDTNKLDDYFFCNVLNKRAKGVTVLPKNY